MATLTKKRKAALAKFDASKIYSLQEATQIVKQVSNTKFDGTVDIAARLGVDPKKSTEMVRGAVSLPHGTNQELEKAGRVADFLELGELMCMDALNRNESCGGHSREEYQTPEGEALRDDANYAYVAAWEWTGEAGKANLHKQALSFEEVKLTQRSYE